MIKAIKAILPTAEAIQRLLHPHAEVVIHDIRKNQIAAIFHPFSKRRVGDSSLLTQEEMSMLEDCMGPYEKINWDGKKLKSVSSIIRDDKGEAVGMLCINLDISRLEKINDLISGFIGHEQLTLQPAPLFKDDWQEKINKYVHAYLDEHHLTLESLNRTEKKELIEHLHKIGAFTAKNAALYIAQVIGVSRATIYNYLSDTEKAE
ncbi:MAG TPA: PAS domain-containing protein [Gammaproteobacteria bacterium]|nr:PAS domain-containing protein [Gammaproteobacteria bacterium]